MEYKDDFLILLEDIYANKPCVVSKFLIDSHRTKTHMTWIGIQDDMVTFIPFYKVERHYKELCDNYPKQNFPFKDYTKTFCMDYKNPVKIKIGRFINKLNSFTNSEIEIFTNNFKGYLKFKTDKSRFELISGQDIKQYYLEDAYQHKRGQLGKSCMRHEKCQPYLDIYAENTEICQLLILKGFNTDKIVGRALIWTLSNGEKYLDRPYCLLDSDMVLFEAYAKTLGCNKSYNVIYDLENPTFVEITIKPKKIDFDYYPYMDTFKYFYPSLGIFNSEIIIGNDDCHELDCISGNLPTMISKINLLNNVNIINRFGTFISNIIL
jgi:hypothetical protein